ncbi:hypothetical protein HUG20_03745 [Salicibibacter cibi]|uniref:Uncharacterized protein n=1 Tax=Salicibibacter cibi TaxID=2743001 RepID=A0A7T6Z921_9BACI|nr:hypothetical protein [Salicibibacter cibi]QQK79102.1 hypothetical protein HUG20_03745 [Salicibibacter cibi]
MKLLKDKKAVGMFVLSIILAMVAAIFAVYGNMLWIVTLVISQVLLVLAFLRFFMNGGYSD